MKFITLITIFLSFPQILFAQNKASDVVGIWITAENESKIEIFEQEGKFYGKIVWLREMTLNGKPKIDGKNPNLQLKNRPIQGMIFMENFTFDGKYQWTNGNIYDSRSGKTYSSKMGMLPSGQLEIKGCVMGILCGGENWIRLTQDPPGTAPKNNCAGVPR